MPTVVEPASPHLHAAFSRRSALAGILLLSAALAPAQPTFTFDGPEGNLLRLRGLDDSGKAPSVSIVPSPTSRHFHVDSRTGSDAADGTTASAGSGSVGPWRSLARLARADLAPGDRVVLACGSIWNETLRIARAGTGRQPITIAAAPDCDVPPTIDGSVSISAAEWSRSGSVVTTRIEREVLQLHAGASWLAPSHHPNNGPWSGNGGAPWAPLPAVGRASVLASPTRSVVLGQEIDWPVEGMRDSAGLHFVVRLNSWLINDVAVESVNGRTLQLAEPTTFPPQSGWGYLLTGQAWMVDSPGEWHHDSRTGTLTLMTASAGPGSAIAATVLRAGIDLSSRSNVVVSGVRVRRVGTGAVLRGSENVLLHGVQIADTADRGIDAAASRDVRIEHGTVERTGLDAIAGYVPGSPAAEHLTVVGNRIRQSGLLLSDGRIVSLPRRSLAAIHGGPFAVVTDNLIADAGYIGIRSMRDSRIEHNIIVRACRVLDDCAGIYIWRDGHSRIAGNVVVGSVGATDGRPLGTGSTAAQGIYLDESSNDNRVEGNISVNNDNGLQIHVSSRNLVSGNSFMGNRRSEVWLQVTRNRERAEGDMVENVLEDNLLVATSPGADGIRIDNPYGDTAPLARFDGNRLVASRDTPVRLRAGQVRRDTRLADLEAAGPVMTVPTATPKAVAILINAGTAPARYDCPYTGSMQLHCGSLRLRGGGDIKWPLELQPFGSAVLELAR